jgi:hypothetical protein
MFDSPAPSSKFSGSPFFAAAITATAYLSESDASSASPISEPGSQRPERVDSVSDEVLLRVPRICHSVARLLDLVCSYALAGLR